MTNMPLSFDALRAANIARQAEWPGAENVDLAFRGLELSGEIGELCNILKKLVRLQRGIKGTTEERDALMAEAFDELADAVICLDLIGMELGIDLAHALIFKFNRTSIKHKLKTRLGGN